MQIPGYRFIRKINHGGMSTVYLAIQESVGRVVALKIMSPALNSDPSYSERFQREANIVGQLSHPHIVSIYDIGRHNNYNYIAMDYLPGGSIHDKMLEGTNAQQALKILKEIGSALDHAHERGYIHRDIKPENILFRDDGSSVLTDFGVARALAIGSRATHAGTVVGTPHYMSPEQTRGKTVDGRSDLYSLGIVFYEMLTGTVPYQGEEAVTIALKHLASPLPTLPAQFIRFQPILDKLLDKEAEKRYQTGRELVADIEMLQLQMRNQGDEYLSSGGGLGRQFASLFSVLLRKTRSNFIQVSSKLWQICKSLRFNREQGFYRAENTTHNISDQLTQQNTLVATRIQQQYQQTGWLNTWRQIPVNYRWTLIGASGLFLLALALLFLQSAETLPVKETPTKPLTVSVQADSPKLQRSKPATLDTSLTPHEHSAQESGINRDQTAALSSNNVNLDSSYPELLSQAASTPSNEANTTLREETKVFGVETALAASAGKAIDNKTNPEPIAPSEHLALTTNKSIATTSESTDTTEPKLTSPSVSDELLTDTLQTPTDKTTETLSANEESESEAVESDPTPARFALTVTTDPASARVRIMNIRPKYSDGMKLKPGRYRVEATAPGYQRYLRWVKLSSQDLTHKITLKPAKLAGSEFSDLLKAGGKAPAMVVIPAGEFTLGGPDDDTQPYQKIRFNQPFAIGKYEVTFAQYEIFAQQQSLALPGDNKWGRKDRPVINVSWEEASQYARWLSKQTGHTYRLPSEAEWEYVAKTGRNTAFWWGNNVRDASQKANCRRYCDSDYTGLFRSKTAPVGSFAASDFNIHDSAGNVAEWTADCYQDSYEGLAGNGQARTQDNCSTRVIRGGSMLDDADEVTAFKRRHQPAHTLHEDVGFRLVRELK
ncbi:bifunctional serine/threonine-protein kinase/formylglycine-generating enzyme family protein [Gilvimarinus sp. 1_MG-2023]|uniref:bifunctional serine/threonine-protein kinase/formylglycine-generating enzyme family protein n=1 Tax=Gilvimarinus sp. 1_MG-2023 TaxID=3062638 RepID=UPI0026E22D31|nr:bifunctional serine/threonine-protein kinase/formylglycine-generating enzyme family protein [Gilvimarinus sp. 1_MG-2023]MDO6745747.1 SUMF1/EgtB/PvdO family nonheme iron enzyme [Gilvimarinus sp. 1_MG-2023]